MRVSWQEYHRSNIVSPAHFVKGLVALICLVTDNVNCDRLAKVVSPLSLLLLHL